MKFNDWVSIGSLDMDDVVRLCEKGISNLSEHEIPAVLRMGLEVFWKSKKRPYYSVYPGILKSLLSVNLDICANQIGWPLLDDEGTPVPLCIRTAEHPNDGLKSVLCTDRGDVLVCVSQIQISGELTETCSYCKKHVSVSDFLQKQFADPKTLTTTRPYTDPETLTVRKNPIPPPYVIEAWQLVVAVCLLGRNSDFIRPEVLSADTEKYKKTLDEKYVAKAIRRGKYGWTVGAEIEHVPHLRRPHFAIRWTGPLGKKPVLTAIKGSVVNRKKITEVPTGYLDNELAASN